MPLKGVEIQRPDLCLWMLSWIILGSAVLVWKLNL